VLGIDNLVFIAIVAGRLPPERQNRARQVGLALALITRLALLASIVWIIGLTRPVFELFGRPVSWRDIVLIAGGLFLLYKGTREIHQGLEGDRQTADARGGRTSFAGVVAQIMLLDIVFSLDSVITAVGMANTLGVMAAAIIIAGDHARGIETPCRFRRATPDREDAGIEFSVADRHDAGRRRRRLRHSQRVYICCDRILGRGRDPKPIGRAAAQIASQLRRLERVGRKAYSE